MDLKKNFLCLFMVLATTLGFAQDRPNIVFIEVDDLTFKYLGCFGSDFVKSPNVDKLADEGVLFENACTQGMMCGPSRNSLISVQYPHNLGFYQNGDMKSLPKGVWTFPKALKSAGYHTSWVGKCHVRPYFKGGKKGGTKDQKKTQAMKTEMGFDDVYQSMGRVVVLKEAKKLKKKGKTWQAGIDNYGDYLNKIGKLDLFLKEAGKKPTTLDGDTEYMDGHFTTKALEWMKEYKGQKPFFLWVNYSCPHGPFDVPQKYHDMYDVKDAPKPIANNLADIPEGLKPHPEKRDMKKLMKDRTAYVATVTYMDEQVGRVVQGLKDAGVYDNTVIVFFSDHGIMLGDHGLAHKTTLFKEVTNPSLIVSYPKGFKKGKRIATPVELLDLGMTTLDIAQMSDTDKEKCPNGYSLLPFLTGKGKYKRKGGVVFGEVEGFQAVISENYKYIANDGEPIVFDLKNDKDELSNRVGAYPKVEAKMKKQHTEWIKETGEILPPAKKLKQ